MNTLNCSPWGRIILLFYKSTVWQLTAACIKPCLCSVPTLHLWYTFSDWWYQKCSKGDIHFWNHLVLTKHWDIPSMPLSRSLFVRYPADTQVPKPTCPQLLGNIRKKHNGWCCLISWIKVTTQEKLPTLLLKDLISIAEENMKFNRKTSAIHANRVVFIFNKDPVQAISRSASETFTKTSLDLLPFSSKVEFQYIPDLWQSINLSIFPLKPAVYNENLVVSCAL